MLFPHKVEYRSFQYQKDEYGKPVKTLNMSTLVRCVVSVKKVVSKDLEAGLLVKQNYEILVRKKDFVRLNPQVGVDEVVIEGMEFLVESIEPVFFLKGIDYYILSLRKKHESGP